MAYRARIRSCLYVTAAGSFQSWHRDRDDRIVWRTFPSLEQAIAHRDERRRERAKLLETPRRVRVAQRLAELLSPPLDTDAFTRTVHHFEENYDEYATPPDAPFR